MEDADITLLFFALAALKGRSFSAVHPCPGALAELREFVEHVGATFEEVESGRVIFHPPAAQ